MVTSKKITDLLVKSGFHRVWTPKTDNVEWWILPFSGRALEIVNLANYKPLEPSKENWLRIVYLNDDDAFISDLLGQLSPFEHDLVQIMLDND